MPWHCLVRPAATRRGRRGSPGPGAWRICRMPRPLRRRWSRPAARRGPRRPRASAAYGRPIPAARQTGTPAGPRSGTATVNALPGGARPAPACPGPPPARRPGRRPPAAPRPGRGRAYRPAHRHPPAAGRTRAAPAWSAAARGGYGRGWPVPAPRRHRLGASAPGCAAHAPAAGAGQRRSNAPAPRRFHRTKIRYPGSASPWRERKTRKRRRPGFGCLRAFPSGRLRPGKAGLAASLAPSENWCNLQALCHCPRRPATMPTCPAAPRRWLSPRHLLWASVAVALVTIVLKTLAWHVTGSVGLLSDAMESFVNLAGAMFALAMVTVAQRPADDDHPYGHHKAEYFSSGFEGVLIVGVSVGILWAAGYRLREPQPIAQPGWGMGLSLLSSALNGLLAWMMLRSAREHRSVALEADARHLVTDVWTSAGVLARIAGVALPGWPWPGAPGGGGGGRGAPPRHRCLALGRRAGRHCRRGPDRLALAGRAGGHRRGAEHPQGRRNAGVALVPGPDGQRRGTRRAGPHRQHAATVRASAAARGLALRPCDYPPRRPAPVRRPAPASARRLDLGPCRHAARPARAVLDERHARPSRHHRTVADRCRGAR